MSVFQPGAIYSPGKMYILNEDRALFWLSNAKWTLKHEQPRLHAQKNVYVFDGEVPRLQPITPPSSI